MNNENCWPIVGLYFGWWTDHDQRRRGLKVRVGSKLQFFDRQLQISHNRLWVLKISLLSLNSPPRGFPVPSVVLWIKNFPTSAKFSDRLRLRGGAIAPSLLPRRQWTQWRGKSPKRCPNKTLLKAQSLLHHCNSESNRKLEKRRTTSCTTYWRVKSSRCHGSVVGCRLLWSCVLQLVVDSGLAVDFRCAVDRSYSML